MHDPQRIPIPISPADRALIDRHIAEHGITYVPRGVSGLDDSCDAPFRCRNDQPEKLRSRLAKRRQIYRRLVDEGKTCREISEIVGVQLASVYGALSRMRLKIKPKMFVASDAP